jgi:hypothetical protein
MTPRATAGALSLALVVALSGCGPSLVTVRGPKGVAELYDDNFEWCERRSGNSCAIIARAHAQAGNEQLALQHYRKACLFDPTVECDDYFKYTQKVGRGGEAAAEYMLDYLRRNRTVTIRYSGQDFTLVWLSYLFDFYDAQTPRNPTTLRYLAERGCDLGQKHYCTRAQELGAQVDLAGADQRWQEHETREARREAEFYARLEQSRVDFDAAQRNRQALVDSIGAAVGGASAQSALTSNLAAMEQARESKYSGSASRAATPAVSSPPVTPPAAAPVTSSPSSSVGRDGPDDATGACADASECVRVEEARFGAKSGEVSPKANTLSVSYSNTCANTWILVRICIPRLDGSTACNTSSLWAGGRANWWAGDAYNRYELEAVKARSSSDCPGFAKFSRGG